MCDAETTMVSRSQVRRAGERLRRDETPSDADRRIYADYRDTFEEPLHEVGETIRRFVADAPTQSRLKRFETVVEKLRRGTSDLSRLEDIAGCRVILPTMVEQHQTRSRIREAWDVVRERDYQTTPRAGYRALSSTAADQPTCETCSTPCLASAREPIRLRPFGTRYWRWMPTNLLNASRDPHR